VQDSITREGEVKWQNKSLLVRTHGRQFCAA
jgi:hypothetical protein